VLIIDDEPVDRERCVRFLQQIPAVASEIVAVSTVSEANAQLRLGRFDCIITDYHLADQTGLEFAAEHCEEGDPPIILLTGNGSETVVLAALRAGVADYLIKSTLTANGLHRAIHNAVEKADLRDSVRARNETIARTHNTLQRRSNEIQRFYHTVSHELKTPLTAAREFISLVVDGVAGDINEQQRDFLMHAVDCCDQLAMHFNDLVETTRLETGKLKLHQSVQRIEKVVLRAVFSVTAMANDRGITLQHHLPPDLPDVYIDDGRVLQVMANLLTNALKFTDPGGKVDLVVTNPKPDEVRVSVRDTGCGIDAEHVDHIFERLYQVPRDEEHATSGGLGLGLCIAKEIVELHGSCLQVESVKGKGSTFHFSVPVTGHANHHLEEMFQ
jgi:signal transduction histidine kinase